MFTMRTRILLVGCVLLAAASIVCGVRPARTAGSSSEPAAVAARPSYFRLGTPLQTDPYTVQNVSLLADSCGYVVVGYSESSATRRRSIGVAVAGTNGKGLWFGTYGIKRPVSDLQAVRTRDGGLLVWGHRAEPNLPYLLRIGPEGESLWSRTYGSVTDPVMWNLPPGAVVQTSEDGFVLTGTAYDPNGAPVYLLKTDARGDTLWFRPFKVGYRPGPHSVHQTADGGYIVAGVVDGNLSILRADRNGNRLWSKSYGNPGIEYDQGWSVQQTRDGGFVVAGELSCPRLSDDRYAMGPNYDAYLVRTDGNGDSLWTRAYGGRGCQGGGWVRQAADGGFIMAGSDNQSTSGMTLPGDIRTYVVRTNANGDTLWTRSVGGTRNWGRWSVFKTADDGLVIAALDPEDPLSNSYSGRPRKVGPDSVGIRVISIDPTGNVSRPEYPEVVRDFQEGLAAAKNGTKWGYVNEAGTYAIPLQFDNACHFSEGLAAVRTGVRWGFIDKSGRYVIPPQFDSVEEFTRGLAPAKSGGKWGYVDRTGRYVVAPRFSRVIDFFGELGQVEIGDTWIFIDKAGNEVFRPEPGDILPYACGTGAGKARQEMGLQGYGWHVCHSPAIR